MTATRTANKQQVYSVFISKTTTLHGIKLFCTFLSHCCVTAPWNFLISHARFMELVNTTQMFLFLFLNLDMVLLYSTPEHFANIWQIKWNWMRSVKFETVQIPFLKWCFQFVVDQKLRYHGNVMVTWQGDVTTSPLYCHENFNFLEPVFNGSYD